MISRAFIWLTDSALMPRWFICVAVLALLLCAVELVAVVLLWIEGKRFDREDEL